MFLNDLRNRLQPTAVPTIVNVKNPPNPETVQRPAPKRRTCQLIQTVSKRPRRHSSAENGTGSTMPELSLLVEGNLDINVVAAQEKAVAETSLAVVPSNALVNEVSPNVVPNSAAAVSMTSLSCDVSVQTPAFLSNNTPRKMELRRKLHCSSVAVQRKANTITRLRSRLKMSSSTTNIAADNQLTDVIKSLGNFLSGDSLKFVEMQLKLAAKKPKGRRYDDRDKLMAVTLYNMGPKAYRFLAGIFSLPSKTSLSMWLQSMQVTTGFKTDLVSAIASKIKTLDAKDRVCALLIDEVALKSSLAYDSVHDVIVGYEDCGNVYGRKNEAASSALVFMLRGLARKWKQAIGFVFTASACKGDVLLNLLKLCLDQLQVVGVTVKVIITDQGSNFQNVTNTLGVSAEKPFFEHDGRKYFYMYDPPHLIKSIRNNLFKYSVHFDDNKVAKWSDISAFYARDEKQRFRLAPKLTSKHLELPAFSKMKVKFATQVFSRTVAAALETHSMIIGSSASDTAEFLYKFNDIFDSVNGSQLKDSNKLKCAMSVSSCHLSFHESSIKWLKTIRVVDGCGKDVTQTIKCVNGWIMTLSAISELWNDLSCNYGFQFLFGRRLNQDALENFFSVIRYGGGKCDNPTPLQFTRLFRQACCKQLLNPSASSNCEMDVASILTSLTVASKANDTPFIAVGHVRDSCKGRTPSVAVLSGDAIDCLQDSGLYYVCGYLLRKLQQWHNCVDCDMVLQEFGSIDTRALYVNLRQFNQCAAEGRGLLHVSDVFFEYVNMCEQLFQEIFDLHAHEIGVLQTVVTQLMAIKAPVSCNKFPLQKFVHFFVKLRINYMLKFKNRALIVVKTSNKAEKKTAADKKLNKLKHV